MYPGGQGLVGVGVHVFVPTGVAEDDALPVMDDTGLPETDDVRLDAGVLDKDEVKLGVGLKPERACT